MSERKFTRGLGKPGMAAQLRETVSQVVRESTAQCKLHLVEPLDFESYILKNKTILQNDPQRELLLYPSDDISPITHPRKYRTLMPTIPPQSELTECSLFTKECVKSYTSNWNLIHYKYSAYSGSYLELPKILKSDDLKDEVYEVDTDLDQMEEEISHNDGLTKQGYLMKGPEVDRMFPNIGPKSFKRRYCYLRSDPHTMQFLYFNAYFSINFIPYNCYRREVDATYILELHKDEKKGEAKATIVMDFCHEVVKNPKRGKYCFELHMTAGHKSFCLAADNEHEMNDWISKLQLVLHQNKQEEKRAGSLERTPSVSSLPLTPGSETTNLYGTLRGLEQSGYPQLMKYARETDTSIALARRDNRRRLFSVYPFIPHSKPANLAEGGEPYREHFGQRLLVKCVSLRFRLQAPLTSDKEAFQQVEPYMLVICLFDAKEGRKLTEDFYWEVYCDEVDGMIVSPEGPSAAVFDGLDVPPDWLINPSQAVFSISSAHSDVFLVVRIEKILQGSIAQTSEPYTKTTKDAKLGLKVHKSVQAAATRLGMYRMPFAWTARPIFRLYSNEPDTVSDFPGVYRQEPGKLKDEEVLKVLSDYRKLNVDDLSIPVAANLPTGYLSVQPLGLGKGFAGPEIMWIDGQKQIFSVGFKLLSTVQSIDQHLHNFFTHAEKMLANKNVPPSDGETTKILKATHAVQLNSAIAFLPTLLNQLFTLLVSSGNEEISTNIIRLLIHVVSMVHGSNSSEALNTYVKFVFVCETSDGRTVHEELANYLPRLLNPTNTDFLLVNKFLSHSGFFFQIMVKSMAQHLLLSGRIKMHRHERFQPDFLNKIENLLKVLSPYLLSKYREMPQETKQLNASIANFLKRCLSFLDRGFVLRLVSWYLSTFGGEARVLYELKFAFLNVICSHEHYVAFNLPLLQLKGRSDICSEFWLSEEFCRRHYLAGLLLIEAKNSLSQEASARRLALNTLRDLMAKHELDDRYQAKGQLARIASLYIPWLGIVLDNLYRLAETQQSAHSPLLSTASSVVSTPSKPYNRFTFHQDSQSARTSLSVRDSTYLAAIAGQVITNGGSNVSLDSETSTVSGDGTTISQETAIHRDADGSKVPSRHARSVSGTQALQVRCEKLQASEVKDILVCFLFVLKHLGHDQVITWWHNCSHEEILNFFKVIQLCLHEFKYTGRRQIAILANTSQAPSRSGKGTKSMTLPARMHPPDFSTDPSVNIEIKQSNDSSRHPLLSGSNSIGRDSAPLRDGESSSLYQALLEANLATEVGLTVLDVLGLYCLHFRDTLTSDGGDNQIMASVFSLYLSFLQVGQSETLFRHVFAALRAFINNFSRPLFQGNATLCGQLCLELLRCCNSRLSAIRQEACAILYLLMRSNFEFSLRKGLTRVHLQVIISVSQLLGNIVGLNNARFQESLSLINSYASSDKAMKGTGFPTEVKDLTKRIRTVLMATAQMKELHHEPEVLTDLQHSLANSYASTPELRLTWLETMTRNHANLGNFSEAACCQLHIAALMAQYLKLKNEQDWGAEAFSPISINIARDENSLKLDSGVQDVQYTENGLLEQMEICADYLEKAERYECLYYLYNLILPIYHKKRDYAAMSRAYHSLSEATSKITQVQGKRLLGRFYRITFFGQGFFEKDSGIEYIYKEPKVTSLSEISERLLNQYTNKFGSGLVKIIMDSSPIDENDLDPKIAHIQVTHVTPYWDKNDSLLRVTEFEQNHNISTFMFETPFTKDGKPRGTPAEQYKRRTILTTDYAFPYVKKRLKVIHRVESDLTPIEVALDEMRQRVSELEEVVFTKPPDVKKLQLKLQGSVAVQVNAGPLAYASAFLDPALSPQFPDDKVEELKDVFREFVRVCYAALQLNSRLVRSDQAEYQMALRQNLHKLAQELSHMFSETLWPDSELGSFKRNSQALFSAISGASSNSSSA
ncbi:unnamed protein product [Nesidiocoris tenuis]|uniref:Dedicator of cytokinesis protein 9 n=1 Tax=Nesidiocoris tenuis TaxID=355587 RepID=A0A6H5HH80_9HEMI|nr:unnamed protein product [Nesidiocoris tenuis]